MPPLASSMLNWDRGRVDGDQLVFADDLAEECHCFSVSGVTLAACRVGASSVLASIQPASRDAQEASKPAFPL